MDFTITKDGIKIYNLQDFCPEHILECGQMFCYEKIGDSYFVYPENKLCKITTFENYILIETSDIDYFKNFFNLQIDYSKIKKDLQNFKELSFALNFGHGIRIVKQNLLETIITFIFSANNNMKRIKSSLDNLRKHFGHKIKNDNGFEFYAFPSLEELKTLDIEFFKSIGAGYRASYLVETIGKLDQFLINNKINSQKSTKELLNSLISLKGVGRKVADCILLFGYNRLDVFPVDTWIKQVYKELFKENIQNASKISDMLLERYGDLSGYAQQYLFYSKRSEKHV